MKIVIVQTNPIPGDFAANTNKIIEGLRDAKDGNAQLVVFPEMAIPGYLCKDSMLTEGFAERNLAMLHVIANASSCSDGLTIVVGYAERNLTGVGKPFFNSVAIIRNGSIIGHYRKHLLPFYDVFDEGRYFEPGKDLCVVEIAGIKFGILNCEDGWNDKDSDAYRYDGNPVEQYRHIGVNNFIWVNSSPYVFDKPHRRQRMVRKISQDNRGIVVYCNQVGGMDDLVFDGNSMVAASGTILFACGEKEGSYIVDLSKNDYGYQSCDWSGEIEIRNALRMGLGDYIKKTGFKHVVVASSGGIDSALTLALTCDVVNPKNVHAIRMPSIYSSKGSVDDALALHQVLGCNDYLVPIDHEPQLKFINSSFNSNQLKSTLGYRGVADENIQARLRAINLMHFSNAFGALALTTGNKSENATGYCTLGGDTMGGFAPLQDLYKTQVYLVSRLYDSIPKNILNKAPSAELAPDQNDEDSLLPYAVLDPIIFAYVEMGVMRFETFRKLKSESFVPLFGRNKNGCEKLTAFLDSPDAESHYSRIIRLIDLNEFKRRQVAPGIKLSKVAFGSGRRFPIARGRWA